MKKNIRILNIFLALKLLFPYYPGDKHNVELSNIQNYSKILCICIAFSIALSQKLEVINSHYNVKMK